MLSAERLPPVTGMWRLPGTRLHRLVVWTFRRGSANPAAWFPRQVGEPGPHAELPRWCKPFKCSRVLSVLHALLPGPKVW